LTLAVNMPAKQLAPWEQLIQQGEERGFQWSQCIMLVRQLSARFGGQVNYDLELRLRTASLEQIARYAERVLSAGSLAEVLAD
jgi:hypothetical protein